LRKIQTAAEADMPLTRHETIDMNKRMRAETRIIEAFDAGPVLENTVWNGLITRIIRATKSTFSAGIRDNKVVDFKKVTPVIEGTLTNLLAEAQKTLKTIKVALRKTSAQNDHLLPPSSPPHSQFRGGSRNTSHRSTSLASPDIRLPLPLGWAVGHTGSKDAAPAPSPLESARRHPPTMDDLNMIREKEAGRAT
jgi:hypothetical protein